MIDQFSDLKQRDSVALIHGLVKILHSYGKEDGKHYYMAVADPENRAALHRLLEFTPEVVYRQVA